jgi:hypothetical protein
MALIGNNIRTIGCTWLPKMSTYSLALIRPLRVIIEPAEYQDIAAQITTEPPLRFTIATVPSGL